MRSSMIAKHARCVVRISNTYQQHHYLRKEQCSVGFTTDYAAMAQAAQVEHALFTLETNFAFKPHHTRCYQY